ncbi:paraquat-inducible protein A [Nafulsella turpanensis]|uniref:paraquat-inducible protein A n=1 Tax=Nafulsella turpanensis TaxID=1265690 RepID=UPI0003491581|nr:paraquat-inducible protein A [Nafulsella turpanensis]
MPKFLQQSLLVLFTGALLLIAGWSCFQVYQYSSQRAEIKKDYSEVNSITYGLLSVNTWRDHLTTIALNRIEDFEFTPAQEDTLVHMVGNLMYAGIDKVDSLVDRKQTTIKGKLKKFAFKTLVDEEKIRETVPLFSQTLVNEIQKPENKEALKYIVRSKLLEYSNITHANAPDSLLLDSLLNKYEAASLDDFNRQTAAELKILQESTYFYTYIALAVVLVFLILWWVLKKQKAVHIPLFVMSVLVSLVILAAGISAPMIEIDARFQEVNFLLIGEKISFNDQVIFFQSKSIIDVVQILLETGQIDSVLVGVLILAFSILFPIAKLISTQIYLMGSKRIRSNKILNFFAFKSGKWSMADVYVIAIFMAYIGFQGILDNQLSILNVDTESLMSISTNKTSLQPGFLLFIGFVLFSLLLSLILKKVTSMEKKAVSPAERTPLRNRDRQRIIRPREV